MVNRVILLFCLAVGIAGCSGSGPGHIYTNIIRPYSRDFNHTPAGVRQCRLKAHQIKEPVSGYGVTIEWSTSQIQAAARAAGISNIRYMDVQTISFIMGIYTQRILIIYGD
jgi:hypothetical protein